MLYVYDNKKDFPKDKKYVEDVEAWFMMPKYHSRDVDILLREIEKGAYVNNVYFRDRFGVNLYCSFISTGCKAGILTATQPDKIVNTDECGWNVIKCLFRNLISGNVYIDSPMLIDICGTAKGDIDVWYRDRVFRRRVSERGGVAMIIEEPDIRIESNVDKGLYVFYNDSSTGKTRLLQLLRILEARGYPVQAIDYASYRVSDKKLSILMVDRYDRFGGTLDEELDRKH